jgi:hypothetical protein
MIRRLMIKGKRRGVGVTARCPFSGGPWVIEFEIDGGSSDYEDDLVKIRTDTHIVPEELVQELQALAHGVMGNLPLTRFYAHFEWREPQPDGGS